MTILLPTKPGLKSGEPEAMVKGGWLSPDTGSEEQWIGRLGSRMRVIAATPNLKPDPDARLWVAALLSAWFTGELVGLAFPQPWLKIGAPGAIVVDGAGQRGMSLRLRGGTPNYAIRKGQFFSLMHDGRRYLHFARDALILDGSGAGELAVAPMLRVVPADGDACEFGRPIIEGKVGGSRLSWTHVRARTQGLSFSVEEIR